MKLFENPGLEETVFEGDGTGIRSSLIPVLHGIYRNRIDSFREIFTGRFYKVDENCMGAQKERSTWLLKNLCKILELFFCMGRSPFFRNRSC